MTTHSNKACRSRSYICLSLTATICLAGMVLVTLITLPANASYPTDGPGAFTSVAAAPNGGFWVQRDGNPFDLTGTYAIDGAPQFESVQVRGSIAAIPGREGYWIVSTTGEIYARGDAPELCEGELSNCSGYPSNPRPGERIVAAAAAPYGHGLWALTVDRKVWTAGDVESYGDVTNDNRIPTGIVATPSGRGYYIVCDDGGVFAFGDAVFFGSTGGNKPGGRNVTGMALSLDGQGQVNGYWLVADDGGVFTFGKAPFLGSTGGNNGGSSVTGITAQLGGHSYAWVHANGGVELPQDFPEVIVASRRFSTVLGPLYGGTESGTPLGLFAANGNTSQQWELRPTTGRTVQPGSVVQLLNARNGLCVDVTGEGPSSAEIIQFPCKTSAQGWDNQLWRMIYHNGATQFVYYGEPTDRPYYTLAGDAAGNLFIQFSANGNPGWNLVPAQ